MRTYTSILSHLGGLAHQRDNATFDPLTGMRLVPRDSFVCFADSGAEGEAGGDDGGGDGDDGGGDDGESAAKFTGADVERLVKRRLSKQERSHKRALAEATKGREELEAQLAELTERLEKNDSAEQKKVSSQERELAKALSRIKEYEGTVSTLTGERDTASKALKDYIIRDKVRSALQEAGALPTALRHASSLFAIESGADLVEEGDDHVVIVRDGDLESDDLKGAATSWLKRNTHFAKHPGGGTGETRPRGTNGTSKRPLTPDVIEKSNPAALVSAGFAKHLARK